MRDSKRCKEIIREERFEMEDDSKEYGAYGLGNPHVTLAKTEGSNFARRSQSKTLVYVQIALCNSSA